MHRAPAAPFALAAALALAAVALRAEAPPPGASQAPGAAGTESSGDSGTFTVYLPQQAQTAAPRPLPRRAPTGESALAVSLVAALFAAGGLAWLGLRTPVCPRCRQKLVRLERAASGGSSGSDAGPAAGDAVRPLEDWIDGARRDPWACLGCGVVMRRRFGSIVASDDVCPSCGASTKKTRLDVRERPGYLTWGEVQLDESCLSCSHRTSALYAAPPLEAPSGQRGASLPPTRGTASRSPR